MSSRVESVELSESEEREQEQETSPLGGFISLFPSLWIGVGGIPPRIHLVALALALADALCPSSRILAPSVRRVSSQRCGRRTDLSRGSWDGRGRGSGRERSSAAKAAARLHRLTVWA